MIRSTTLSRHPAGPAVAAALQAGLDAIDPARLVATSIAGEGATSSVAGHPIGRARTCVIAIGKAAAAMARPVITRLGDSARGIVVTGHAPALDPGLPVVLAGHPLPDAGSFAAALRIEALLADAREDDVVIVLLSGGASALVCAPPPEVSLHDVCVVTDALLRAGADIVALNTIRKHLDRLKGGRLAALAHPARVITLVLSDVMDDPLDVIGSGPTVADGSTFADALDVLAHHRVDAPGVVLRHLATGAAGLHDDSPRADDVRLSRSTSFVIGRNATVTDAAAASLRKAGVSVLETVRLRGEAGPAGATLAGRVAALHGDRPLAVVAGGETVVHVRGSGRGGRNQEVALAAVAGLAGSDAHLLAALATDGEDGPTDAAGAVVAGDTAARAAALGLDASASLRDNDAYPFFAALDDLLRPGPTGTNACDVAIGVYDPRRTT